MDQYVPLASLGLALLGALGGLFGFYLKRRADQLRRDDVLRWALEAIASLQTIAILCEEAGKGLSDAEAADRIKEQLIASSILIEQGRLYFRNVPHGSLVKGKPPAYQGLRPRLLDYLLVAHKVACAWPTANAAARSKLARLAKDSCRQFVSLLQHEVGRDRTATSGTSEGGHHVDLPHLMQQLGTTVSSPETRL